VSTLTSVKLYAYWRSSASWRVRIALAMKGIVPEIVVVNLLEGEQREGAHRARSPLGQVPVMELPDGTQLTQSLAIVRYLDQVVPEPPLVPRDPVAGARAWALAEVVNAGIQPLQNLSLLGAVTALGADKKAWGAKVIREGLVALQQLATPHAGDFLVGDAPSVADLCLVPQLYNARRFGVELDDLLLLTQVEARCEALAAFAVAHPDHQPDAVAS
jgi:maleylpyruvate isomerase